MLEIVILPSFSIFKYYNWVRVCSRDLFYFACVMHVTRYYFIGCHSAQYRAERLSAAGGGGGAETCGAVLSSAELSDAETCSAGS